MTTTSENQAAAMQELFFRCIGPGTLTIKPDGTTISTMFISEMVGWDGAKEDADVAEIAASLKEPGALGYHVSPRASEQQAVPVAQEYPASAIGALTGHQRQIDSDGSFVGVSRQALDELIAWAETHRLSLPCKSGEGAVDADEFATVEAWEHDDQRELSLLYNHAAHDRPQFNRGQMRTAIRHGKLLAIDATQTREAELVEAFIGGLSGGVIGVLKSERFKEGGWELPVPASSPLIRKLVDSGLFRLSDSRCGFEATKDGWIKPTPAGLLARAALNARGDA